VKKVKSLNRHSLATYEACQLAVGLFTALTFSISVCSADHPDKEDRAMAKLRGEQRTLNFPGNGSFGAVILVPSEIGAGQLATEKSTFGTSAKGSVCLTVPPGWSVMLVVNRRVFENPQLLDEIPPQGIDALKVGLMSMSEQEDGWCDRALKHITHFPDLKFLDVEQSDTSDEALSGVRSLKKLKVISMNQSRIDGACFRYFSSLSELTKLNAERCGLLKPDNLAYLAAVPNLRTLALRWSRISDIGLRQVGRCEKLEFLDLSKNPAITGEGLKYLTHLDNLSWLRLDETGITDQGLKYLIPLKKLQSISLQNTKLTDTGINSLKETNLTSIDLRGTRVSIKGLESLKGLKLKTICVPRATYSESDLLTLKRCFPSTRIVFNISDAPSEHDLKEMFEPLSK
jgi:hypothetical protein